MAVVVYEGVRGLTSPDPVLDAFWWSGAGLVSQFDVDSELWKPGVGLWH